MVDRVLKVTRAGEPLLEGAPVDPEALERVLGELREAGDRLVYYREAPFSDPSVEVLALVDRLVASGVPLVTSDQVPSEWGELAAFSLYLAPATLRLLAEKEGQFTFAHHPEGAERPQMLEVEMPPQERLRDQLDLLIRSDRVLESEPRDSERAFQASEVESPSLHVRIEYMDRAPWISWYAPDDIPGNLHSLMEDCAELGRRILGVSEG